MTSVDTPHSGNTTPTPLVQRVATAGFRLNTFTPLARYIRQCREDRQCPNSDDILRLLLPKAAVAGLIPKSPPPVSY